MDLAPASLRQRLSDLRRARQLVANTARDVTPPPPGAFRSFGANSWIVPPARVTSPECISIGAGVVILEHSWLSVVSAVPGITPRLTVGDRTRIGRMAHIACVGDIEIGSDVLTAERIFIGDTYHGYEDATQPIIDQPMAAPRKVTIGDGAFLGIGSIVLMGVSIGAGAYVAAGAVVTEDVPPRTLVVGNPARPVRAFDDASGAWRDLPRG